MQNGVLKALSFLFEYIGEMGKDYIYAVTPLLQDALMDRDLVHRQTAASVVQHMSLGVAVSRLHRADIGETHITSVQLWILWRCCVMHHMEQYAAPTVLAFYYFTAAQRTLCIRAGLATSRSMGRDNVVLIGAGAGL